MSIFRDFFNVKQSPIFTGYRFGFGSGGAGEPPIPETNWTRILNQAGPASGTLSTGGYNQILCFGVGAGASGAAGSDDDGGGGGAGGAGQFNGYKVTFAFGTTLTYSVGAGGAGVVPRGSDGNPGGDTTISDPSGVVFSLTGGAGAAQSPTNGGADVAPATATPPYGSHGGGAGGIQIARSRDLRPTDGTPGAYGGAGGGGGGAWLGSPTRGSSGRNNTLGTQTVSTYDGRPLDVTFTAVGTNGTAGSYPDTNGNTGDVNATFNPPAGGSQGGEYAGGGGAGGGTRFFGTGNGGYGAGGGGNGGQNPYASSGSGGHGYLVVYGRSGAV
tara:strand:+ start:798 stop:1781 length:984 start_codon:yes stop_codon:yes gene_type:complete